MDKKVENLLITIFATCLTILMTFGVTLVPWKEIIDKNGCYLSGALVGALLFGSWFLVLKLVFEEDHP